MRLDIPKEIAKAGKVLNIIVLTHNIDYVFLQLVVLPVLRKCGDPNLTILADTHCANDAYASKWKVASGIGSRFRVVRVSSKTGFRFHPKAILLSSEKKGALYVGSGNLSFGGWQEHAEVWNRYETDNNEFGAFSAFREFLRSITDNVPFGELIREELDKSFDASTREWASNLDNPTDLIWSHVEGKSLLDQIGDHLGTSRIKHAYICSPYFDKEGLAVNSLVQQFKIPSTTLLIPQHGNNITDSAINNLSDSVHVIPVESQERIFEEQSTSGHFVHAKFYAFERSNDVVLFTGSANCSRAGLLKSGSLGNCELLTVQTLSKAAFTELYLDELRLLKDQQVAIIESEAEPDEPDSPRYVITAARYDDGLLQVAYSGPKGGVPSHFNVDDHVIEPSSVKSGYIATNIDFIPSRVSVEFAYSGEQITSNLSWVDNESVLQSSAPYRQLISKVRDIGQRIEKIEDFTGMLDLFQKKMTSTSSSFKTTAPEESDTPKSEKKKKGIKYTESDVFRDLYQPLAGSSHSNRSNQSISFVGYIAKLLRLPEYEEDSTISYNDQDDEGLPNDVSEDEPVDSREQLPKRGKKKPDKDRKEQIEKQKRKARQCAKSIVDRFTREEFLSTAPPNLIADDAMLISLMLRLGLNRNWLDKIQFLELTHKVWSALFFTSSIDPRVGWVVWRAENKKTKEDFRQKMQSATLSASLVRWAFDAPKHTDVVRDIKFQLACSLLVARLPWLWIGDEKDELINALHDASDGVSADDEEAPPELFEYSDKFAERGRALEPIEHALRFESVPTLCKKLTWERLDIGDLVWQGNEGYCVVKLATKRALSRVTTQSLLTDKDKVFDSAYVIPLRAFLEESSQCGLSLTEKHKKVLREFLDDIAKRYRTEHS